MPYILNPTPFTLHLTPYTLHLTPYTLHSTPHTLHLTPYALNSTPSRQRDAVSELCQGVGCRGRHELQQLEGGARQARLVLERDKVQNRRRE